MNGYLSSEAIILRSQDYKEDDKLITFYSVQMGKMRALVKGAKKNNSKLRGAVQPFSVTNLTITMGKTIPVVINGENSRSFNGLQEDYMRLSYASVLSELVDKIMPENEPDEEIYAVLRDALGAISSGNPWSGANAGIFHLLTHLGYGAEYKTCAFCGQTLETSKKIFSHADGLACAECAKEQEDCRSLRTESVTVIWALQELPLKKAGQIYASAQAIAEVDRYIDMQLKNILDYPLKSRDFSKSLQKV